MPLFCQVVGQGIISSLLVESKSMSCRS
jgi:hypothetical protein